MTDTSKREELIERPWTQDHYVTRNSISEDDTYRVWMTCRCGWNSGDLPDGNLPTTHQAELEHYVAVFEQAHTPTDDEREALRDELAGWVIGAGYYQSMVGTSDAAEMADAILAAGFRRTVQGEPTDAQVEAALQALGHARSAVTAPVMRAALRAAAGATNRENGSAEQ